MSRNIYLKVISFFLQKNESISKEKTTLLRSILNYDQLSILPTEKSSFSSNIEIAILVITRWYDYKNRMFLRNTILLSGEESFSSNMKLLFVFGIPIHALKNERVKINSEQDKYHDMIIPGEFYHFHLISKFCFKILIQFLTLNFHFLQILTYLCKMIYNFKTCIGILDTGVDLN